MRVALAVLAVLSGCGRLSEYPTAQHHADALHGGTIDADGGLSEAFMLRMRFNTGQQYVCTATLITSRTLLTAAHCFDPAAAPAGNTTLTDVWVQNGSPAPSSSSTAWIRIDPARTRMHPQWSASDRLSFDLAAAVLPAPSTQAPTPHLTRALTTADVGAPLTVVGFGITAAGQSDYGTRRTAALPLRGLTAKHLQLGDMTATGICNGDSGGPSFLTARDGVRRVAGVHSYDSSLQCTNGLDTRVDLFATSFVQQFIRDEEGGPTCFEDGMCQTGCTPADVDCVCQADGTCNAQCPNLLTDPDCPADCVANGVCATEACPRPDPDCVAELAACTSATQCQYRTCTTDPQRAQPYCSRPCTAGCPTGTSCVSGVCLLPQLPTADPGAACTAGATFCLASTTCTGLPGAATTCQASCTIDTDCGTPGQCIAGQNGFKVCRPTAPPDAGCTADTLCLGSTQCSGFPSEPLTCRATCQLDTQCPALSECLPAALDAGLCVPTAQAGEDCVASVTRCLSGTVCTGFTGESTRCQRTCATDSDCLGSQRCTAAQAGARLCAEEPVQLARLGAAEGPALGCSATGWLGWPLLAVTVLFRRRRSS